MRRNHIYLFLFLTLTIACAVNKNWMPSHSKITEGLHDVEAINDKTAWAYSYGTGNLYKTESGGEQWNLIYQFDSLYYEQIQFVTPDIGWIVGSYGEIYKTIDGGNSWSSQAISPESKALIYAMNFENEQIGYVAPFNNKGTRIYKTTNGGSTWELDSQIDNATFALEKFGEELYAAGYHTIYKKNQLTNSWSEIFRDTSKSVGQIRTIAQDASKKIVAASFDGYIIKETQQGWQKFQLTTNRLRSIIGLPNGKWITVGDNNKEKGNVFVSNDNGSNWKLDEQAFSDIHRITRSKNRIWIVGKEGLIMTKSYK